MAQIIWKEVKLWSGYAILALVPSFVWIIVTDPVVWRKYIFSFSNLFSSYIFEYIKLTPQLMSFIWVITVIGIPLSLIFFRDHLTYSGFTVSVLVYLVYTADSSWPSVEPRFMIALMPLILIISMQLFELIFQKSSKLIIKKNMLSKRKIKQILPIL